MKSSCKASKTCATGHRRKRTSPLAPPGGRNRGCDKHEKGFVKKGPRPVREGRAESLKLEKRGGGKISIHVGFGRTEETHCLIKKEVSNGTASSCPRKAALKRGLADSPSQERVANGRHRCLKRIKSHLEQKQYARVN